MSREVTRYRVETRADSNGVRRQHGRPLRPRAYGPAIALNPGAASIRTPAAFVAW